MAFAEVTEEKKRDEMTSFFTNLRQNFIFSSFVQTLLKSYGTSINYAPESEDEINNLEFILSQMETRTRAEEESMMREPLNGERRCARGSECVCFLAANPREMGFIAVEYLTMEQKKTGKIPSTSNCCVLCDREIINKVLISTVHLSASLRESLDILRYLHFKNLFDSKGEYNIVNALPNPCQSNLGSLIVLHDPRKYKWISRGGKKLILQSGYASVDKPLENFRLRLQ